MTTKTTSILACCVATGLVAAIAPATAHADDTAAPPPAAMPAANLHPGIGGHVGIALPLVFLNSDKTQSISDKVAASGMDELN